MWINHWLLELDITPENGEESFKKTSSIALWGALSLVLDELVCRSGAPGVELISVF